MPVSAEGRVEHQKRNQTATSQWPVGFVFGVQLDYSSRLKSAYYTYEIREHGFLRRMKYFLTDLSNRVEHQKRNQPAIKKWPFGFVFGVQLGLRQTRSLIQTRKNKLLQVEQLWDK